MPDQHLPAWVLQESVDVTRISDSIYLVARVDFDGPAPDGVAVTLTQGERVLVNGLDLDLGDRHIDVVSLLEDVANTYDLEHPGQPLPVGLTIRSHPYREDALRNGSGGYPYDYL